jgi:hypothetical protein
MAQTGFKRYSAVEILSVYNKPADIYRLASEWAEYVKQGGIFCKEGACPFVPGEKFNYDLTNFLYYRARAITADIANLNGDRFPHMELRQSYQTFQGKGVYFNHDSDKPEKAFGIILDAVYTPVHFNNDEFPDKYVELLCAIDRKAINHLRPGLLGDIESGKVTSTSMGTIASMAQCSICGNKATNMEQLCLHVHPQSPLYCKGRDVYGKKCYEDNYGLSFIEDSIVYVPADATARMLEVYASKNDVSVNRMAELFEKYAIASGKPVKRSVIELSSTFKTTGGFMPTAAKPAAQPAPGQPAVSPYQAAVGELNTEVPDATQKLFETKMRRIIEEELRKMYGPALEQMDKSVRPQVKTLVEQEFEKVKGDIGAVVPGMDQAEAGPAAEDEKGQAKPAPAAPAAPAAAAPAAPAPAAATPPAAPVESAMQYPLSFVEDFSAWNEADKNMLVQAVTSGKSWSFKGVLEFPVKEA